MVEIKYTITPDLENKSFLISFNCPNFQLDRTYFKDDYGKIKAQVKSSFIKDIAIYNNFGNVAEFCFNQVKFEYPWEVKNLISFTGPDINEYTNNFFSNE